MGNRATRLLGLWLLSVVIASCGDNRSPDVDATAACTPVDDGNDCTEDLCDQNVPTHRDLDAGATCATGVCDGDGACVGCLEDDDCTTDGQICDEASTTCVDPACDDGEQDGTETDLDCGGDCDACDDGLHCAVPADCTSGVCTGTVCQVPACGDGVTQGDEACDDGNQTNGDGCDDGVGGTCRPTGCGNGVTAGTEACDDGNAKSGDGCDNNCTFTACGNGIRTGTEACDDADLDPADGCSATCTIELGYTCTGIPSVCATTCGDGVRAGTEACDDGGTTAGNGCSSTCTVEPGFTCTSTSPSVCTATCGDGLRSGAETCDDGGTTAGDGCSALCVAEPGYTCTGAGAGSCTTTCGDGIRAGAEACDDGGTTAGNGCSATCTVEAGYSCAGAPSVCITTCGDGVIAGLEVCDDGGATAGNGCSATCTVEVGYTCTGTPSACTTTCGDGVLAGAEACDDGGTTNGNGCSATCTIEAGYTCVGAPSVCVTTCGDGVGAGAEACDDGGLLNGDGCSTTCTIEVGFVCAGTPSVCVAICGDGIGAATEACDDGGLLNGDGCSSTCTVEPGYICVGTPSVCTAGCGDGIVAGTEACDDGGNLAGDGCSGTCTVELGYTCVGSPSICTTTCGDGLAASTEACDDGGNLAGDGCSPTCSIEVGFACTGSAPSTCAAICGDGLLVGGEGCDDGGTTSGNGCSATCTVEAGYVCAGTPSVCVSNAVCGDGTTSGAETCDDSNTTPLDGCSASCRIELSEREPNEDGTPSIGGSGSTGNDFDGLGVAAANATLQGTILASGGATARLAAITPAGDEDVFAITNDTAAALSLRVDVWNRAAGFGQGVACGTSIDTAMHLRTATGASLALNDDRNGTTDQCSGLSFVLLPGVTVYAHVIEYSDDGVIPGYGLQVGFAAIVCGDGTQVAGLEECDDGNLGGGDGCSATCAIEGTNEAEPNEDGTPSTGGSGIVGNDFDVGGLAVMNANAQGVLDVGTTGRTYLASLGVVGDEDVYALRNASPLAVEVTAFTSDPTRGLGQPCTAIDTGINLRNPAAVVLSSNNDTIASGTCSRITFVIPAGQDRYLHVTENGDNALIARYALTITRAPVVCGNGVVVAGAEECDDGNTDSGDGCSATCTVEGTSELEPNDDGVVSTGGSTVLGNDFDTGGLAAANIDAQGIVDVATTGRTWIGSLTPAGDEDGYAVTNSGATAIEVTATTADLTLGLGQPCVVDTGLNVRNAAGLLIASNDQIGTGGNCSRLVFGVPAGATRYINVVEYGDNALIARYALVITRAPSVCGNGTVLLGAETCDDGNGTNGDGCSSTCAIEAGYTCNAAAPSYCAPAPVATTLACVDMTASTPLTVSGADEAVTATAALPFPVSLYGTATSHFSASTNGFIGLFAASTGTITSSSSNASTVPSTLTPNGYLAPFWDDLVLVNTSSLRSLVTGTAGSQRWTLEWNATIFGVTPVSTVTFQLQINQGGAIEYHYCSGTGSVARVGGSSATIAAENAPGTFGAAFGINQNVVTPGTTAVRWNIP